LAFSVRRSAFSVQRRSQDIGNSVQRSAFKKANAVAVEKKSSAISFSADATRR
jgi:hypothetical protein